MSLYDIIHMYVCRTFVVFGLSIMSPSQLVDLIRESAYVPMHMYVCCAFVQQFRKFPNKAKSHTKMTYTCLLHQPCLCMGAPICTIRLPFMDMPCA